MAVSDSAKTKRLNVMVSKRLIERVSRTAESQGVSVSAFVRKSLEAELTRTFEGKIAEAAEQLAPVYEKDGELTVFTAVDGDEFL